MTDRQQMRDLYPTLTERELDDADENLMRYFKIVLEIACDPHVIVTPQTPVDSPDVSSTMKERSNVSLKN